MFFSTMFSPTLVLLSFMSSINFSLFCCFTTGTSFLTAPGGAKTGFSAVALTGLGVEAAVAGVGVVVLVGFVVAGLLDAIALRVSVSGVNFNCACLAAIAESKAVGL